MSLNLNASQASLRADPAYIKMLEVESAWPAMYNFSRPNPVQPRSHPIMGLNAPAVGGQQVPTYNRLLPRHFRVDTRAAHNKPSTELFGTAPYIALGRGLLRHVDAGSALQQGTFVAEKGSRKQAVEVTWDRTDFVTMPHDLRALPHDLRLGRMTRAGPSYGTPPLQPRDPR